MPPEPSIPAGQESYVALMEVSQAFRKLTAEHQEVLHLVAMESLTYEEAATILEVPVGTIRSRLSRARLALRRLLDETAQPQPTSEEVASDE